MKYLATVEYLGKNYRGSQSQPHKNTIQDEIEKALCTLTQNRISAIFAGRTDSGVNARGQTFHIKLDKKVEPKRFIYALNSFLPDDIIITALREVDDNFHAQKSARYRYYRYVINNANVPCVFDTCTFHYRLPLNADRINQMLNYLKGEHDFSAFKNSSDNPDCVCRIFEAEAKRDGEYIKIDIVGSRFLYNMVRTIVGTILELERESSDPARMAFILNSKDRTQAGMTAAACGLTLIEVGYDDKQGKKYNERQIDENL